MENTHGRDLVEAGQLCERKNGRGVDTNRNWDIDWGKKEKDYNPAEEYPGKAPHRCGSWRCFCDVVLNGELGMAVVGADCYDRGDL
jgi:hypothetical protein